MKKWILGIGCLLMAVASLAEESEFRAFTAKDGRTLEARIVEYDARKGKIKIERQGAGMVWVAPNVFGEADQAYIKEWISASAFLEEKSLRVSVDKKNLGRSGSKEKTQREIEKVGYEVEIKNYSKQALDISKIEYRYYVRNVRREGGEDTEKTVHGTLALGRLDPGASHELKTDSLPLVTKFKIQLEGDGYGIPEKIPVKMSEEELLGIWIRIYGPEVDGTALYRDITYPSDLIKNVQREESGSSFSDIARYRGAASSREEEVEWIDEAILAIVAAPDHDTCVDISKGLGYFYSTEYLMQSVVAAFYNKGEDALCINWQKKLTKPDPDVSLPFFHSVLIELYASSPDTKVQNGALAVEYAEMNVEYYKNKKRNWETVSNHELLARAYARDGQFDLAVKHQEIAIQLLASKPKQQARYLKSFENRLALFRNQKPYTRGEDDVAETGCYLYCNYELVLPPSAPIEESSSYLRVLRLGQRPKTAN
ncbi:hypothetical protein P4C99_01050 [Pontiellaceae bacterium B1224]|nr:hypothetical protein [Pontiellaceae bacterium B1224]